eukprot:TRINITY_DN73725_c0_g1_i1.p1 TRINITY_DN73725_c0_g1~~TRINITY_DN73725_c0_g1_i1.p1  ORF type:complete len:186 (-),score=47.01 TRINITY_DN73725_c0_g1_i1:229-786(-)
MAEVCPKVCILLRHGTPVPEQDNPEQPLSEDGQKEASFTANGIAEYLAGEIGGAAREVAIFHSAKLRAKQTAETVAEALQSKGWTQRCELQEGLKPKDDVAIACELVRTASEPVVVLVGHLPHMGSFAAALLQAPAAAGRLGALFNPASGVALRHEGDSWVEAAQIEVGVSWWMEAPPPPQAPGA